MIIARPAKPALNSVWTKRVLRVEIMRRACSWLTEDADDLFNPCHPDAQSIQ